jgi:hypothetical protein
VFGLPGFLFLFNEVTFGVILLALTVGMAFLWLQKSGMDMGTYRIVAHDPELTLQVLEKVLNEKGLPFTSRGRTLSLTGNGLYVRVQPAPNRSIPPGTRIVIEPENDKTKPLITSLCQKIDEAFLPKGL